MPFQLATWLVVGVLKFLGPVSDLQVYKYMVSAPRLGAALDAILPTLGLLGPVTPSVLRYAIIIKAEVILSSAPAPLTVTLSCLLVVGGADDDTDCSNLATPLVCPALVPAHMEHARFSQFLSAKGNIPSLPELEMGWAPRLFAHERGAGGGMDAVAKLLGNCFTAPELEIVNACSAMGKNEQFATLAVTLLPTPPPLVAYTTSVPGARLHLTRALKRAVLASGSVELGVYDVLTAVPHFPLFHRAVGTDLSAPAALDLCSELMRAALKQPNAPLTLTGMASAASAFEYLLPRLDVLLESNTPPSDRVAFLLLQLGERRQHEATARGSSALSSGAVGAAASSASAGGGGGGYSALHVAKLCDLLADSDFLAICAEIVANLDAQAPPGLSIELIFAYRGPGAAILHHALRGQINAVRDVPVVARIVTELRHHGAQWAADSFADFLLPPETDAMPRIIPSPLPALWDAACNSTWGDFNFEDVIYAVLAECGGHDGYHRIPIMQQFTSLERMRRCGDAMVAFFSLLGYETGASRSLDTVYSTLYAYYNEATAVPIAARLVFIRSVLVAVFRESSACEKAVLAQRDPGLALPVFFVIANSGAIIRLQRARQDAPATNTMARSLSSILSPTHAKQLGLGRKLVPDGLAVLAGGGDGGLGALTKAVAGLGAESPAPVAAAAATATAGSRAKMTPAEKSLAAAERDAAAAEKAKTVVLGSAVKNCVDLTRAGHFGLGRENKQYASIVAFYKTPGVPPPPDGKVPTDLTKLPSDSCPCVWGSRALGSEEAFCTAVGEPGHERGGRAHDVPTGWRNKFLGGLFAVMAQTGKGARVDPWLEHAAAANATCFTGGARAVATLPLAGAPAAYCVPALGPLDALVEPCYSGGAASTLELARFEAHGGHAFVPVWYATPGAPYVALPSACGRVLYGSDSAAVLGLHGGSSREAASAAAVNYTAALFTAERTDLVCFGLFRDDGAGGGEVAGFVASSPAPPGAEARRCATLADARRLGGSGTFWVAVAGLAEAPVARLARLVAARTLNFTEPAASYLLLGAAVGAQAPRAVAPAQGVPAAVSAALRIAPPDVRQRALGACRVLQQEFARAIARDGYDEATRAYLATWLGKVEPPQFAELPRGLLGQATVPTDELIACVPYAAYARPVTSDPLPALCSQPPPYLCVPGWATDWCHALVAEAAQAVASWLRLARDGLRRFARGESGELVARSMPPALALGVENFSPWFAAYARLGHILVRPKGKFALLDVSQAPEAYREGRGFNRAYLAEMLEESGSTDLALRDMLLTHGCVYLADLKPVLLLQPPLRSFFTSAAGFASAHSEVARMAGMGWFEMHSSARLDEGHFELPCLPLRLNPSGCVARKLEPNRYRGIQDFGGPRRRLFELPYLGGLGSWVALLLAFGRKTATRLLHGGGASARDADWVHEPLPSSMAGAAVVIPSQGPTTDRTSEAAAPAQDAALHMPMTLVQATARKTTPASGASTAGGAPRLAGCGGFVGCSLASTMAALPATRTLPLLPAQRAPGHTLPRDIVRSLNSASGVGASRGVRAAWREFQQPGTSGSIPRFTPALRRQAEQPGARDLFSAGLVEPSALGLSSWVGGRWAWPQELKPFFADLLLAIIIIGYLAHLCGMDVYVLTDDAKDWFHQFALATLQYWTCGMLRLDPRGLEAGDLDVALDIVLARCLEMGVSPSSNIAQRALTEILHSLSARFAASEEPYLVALEQRFPAFGKARDARRALSRRTGRDEARCHYLLGYTDDVAAVLMGAGAVVRYCVAHGKHLGPDGCNVTMAIAAKRSLGVHAPFIGAVALTVGQLAYVSREKVHRTQLALAAAMAGDLAVADWVKLAGLLNHLVCVLLMPYYVMYGIYGCLDAARAAHLGQDECIKPDCSGRKALKRWADAVTTTAGTSTLAALHAVARPAGHGVVHAMHSDAAKEGTGSPAICGNLYSKIWIIPLRPEWRDLPIVATEFIGGIVNVMIFAPMLHDAPGLLVLDALVVPTVIAGKASSPLMRFLHDFLVTMPEYARVAHTLLVSHEYGPYNPIADAGSRGKGAALESLMKHMGLHADYVTVPERATTLLDDAAALWARMAPDERAGHQRLELVGKREQPNLGATSRGVHNIAMDGRPIAQFAGRACGGFIGCSMFLALAVVPPGSSSAAAAGSPSSAGAAGASLGDAAQDVLGAGVAEHLGGARRVQAAALTAAAAAQARSAPWPQPIAALGAPIDLPGDPGARAALAGPAYVAPLRACGGCVNCLKPDCGECRFCLDKPKLGGPNLLRKRCVARGCLGGVVPSRSGPKRSAEAPLADTRVRRGAAAVAIAAMADDAQAIAGGERQDERAHEAESRARCPSSSVSSSLSLLASAATTASIALSAPGVGPAGGAATALGEHGSVSVDGVEVTIIEGFVIHSRALTSPCRLYGGVVTPERRNRLADRLDCMSDGSAAQAQPPSGEPPSSPPASPPASPSPSPPLSRIGGASPSPSPEPTALEPDGELRNYSFHSFRMGGASTEHQWRIDGAPIPESFAFEKPPVGKVDPDARASATSFSASPSMPRLVSQDSPPASPSASPPMPRLASWGSPPASPPMSPARAPRPPLPLPAVTSLPDLDRGMPVPRPVHAARRATGALAVVHYTDDALYVPYVAPRRLPMRVAPLPVSHVFGPCNPAADRRTRAAPLPMLNQAAGRAGHNSSSLAARVNVARGVQRGPSARAALMPGSAAASSSREARDAAGLTVATSGAGTERISELLQRAFAPSTNRGDAGHFRAWTKACAHLGASPWRIDVAANSGADPVGHAEEIYLMCMAAILMYSWMRPRSRADPAADPRNMVKKLYGVRRCHRTRWPPVEMVPMAAVNAVLKGMMREFIDAHGFRSLVPKRKLPLTNDLICGMLEVADGARRGALVVARESYYWLSMFTLFTVDAEVGMRKEEVTGDKSRNGITFASLTYKVKAALYKVLTRALFAMMGKGDGVYLAFSLAKNDPIGIYFTATPAFLPWRAAGRCACRALAELDLAACIEPSARKDAPLFGPTPGAFFTASQVDAAFALCLSVGARVPDEELQNYSFHSFRIWLACALLSCDTPRWLIKRMLRWRGDESLDIYARVSDDQWQLRLDQCLAATVDASLVPRLPTLDVTPERAGEFLTLAHALLGANVDAI